MKKATFFIKPNSPWKIRNFAKKVGITVPQARYIDAMREHYITWEHDYIKKPSIKQANVEAR